MLKKNKQKVDKKTYLNDTIRFEVSSNDHSNDIQSFFAGNVKSYCIVQDIARSEMELYCHFLRGGVPRALITSNNYLYMFLGTVENGCALEKRKINWLHSIQQILLSPVLEMSKELNLCSILYS
jgi:hypothetical protein